MFTSFLTTELLYWNDEARSYASIARTYAKAAGLSSQALAMARQSRAAIARMSELLCGAIARAA